MNPLTSSEMSSWQTCQRGWWLTYYRCLRPVRDYAPLASVGTLYHKGLQMYYEDGVASEEMLQLLRNDAEALLMEYPDYGEQILKDTELAAIMLEGYFEWVEENSADVGLKVIGVEEMVEVPVGPYTLRGKIDARMEREFDGAWLQLEHKTSGDLTSIPKGAQTNPQFLTYDLLAFLKAKEEGGRATDGIIVNIARRVKRTPRAKPPFYARHEVRHNVDELRAHYKHVAAIGDQIAFARLQLDSGGEHHKIVPPSAGREHQWKCACAPLGAMFDDGSAAEDYLEELWEPYDPLERYKEAKDE